MGFVVQTLAGPCDTEELIIPIVRHLVGRGYTPLIASARQQMYATFGEKPSLESVVARPQPDEVSYRAALRFRWPMRSRRLPVAGEVFPSLSGSGLSYVLITISEQQPVSQGGETRPLQLEVGYLGEQSEDDVLGAFAKLVEEALVAEGKAAEWSLSQQTSPQFVEMTRSEETTFVTASTVSDDDTCLASILRDDVTRTVAATIKRAGGMLKGDLGKKGFGSDSAVDLAEGLVRSDLLAREYVVICQRTSGQLNRVRSLDVIARMARDSVLCPCGRSIADERVEELFSPTLALQRMLDHSYWTTVVLVNALRELGIPDERVLLNLREGAEEIDAFVDLDGVLLMFELKDSEFSMGHAYPFGGRIGLYRPDYAIIVSTKGVAPEVRDYFKRVKPGASVLYVDGLLELRPAMDSVITGIRSCRARQILALFQPLAFTDLPVYEILGSRLGLRVDAPAKSAEHRTGGP